MTCIEALQRRRNLCETPTKSEERTYFYLHDSMAEDSNVILETGRVVLMPQEEILPTSHRWFGDVMDDDDDLEEFLDCLMYSKQSSYYYMMDPYKLDVFDILQDCTDDTTASLSSCSSLEDNYDDDDDDVSMASTVFEDAQQQQQQQDETSTSTTPIVLLARDSIAVLVEHAQSTEIEIVSCPSSPQSSTEYDSALDEAQPQPQPLLTSSPCPQEEEEEQETHHKEQSLEKDSAEVDHQSNTTSQGMDLVAGAVNAAKGIWEGSKQTPVGLVINVTEGVFGHLAGMVHHHMPHDDDDDNDDNENDSELDTDSSPEHPQNVSDSFTASPQQQQQQQSSRSVESREDLDSIVSAALSLLEESETPTATTTATATAQEQQPSSSSSVELPSLRTLLEDSPSKSSVANNNNNNNNESPHSTSSVTTTEQRHAFHTEDGCSISLAASVDDEWIPLY